MIKSPYIKCTNPDYRKTAMKYKVLLINPDSKTNETETRELSSRGINVVSANNVEHACRMLREDGLIHVVLTEWEVPVSEGSAITLKGSELFCEFQVLRHEVTLFLYTSQADLPYFRTGGNLSGYFYKGEHDFDDIVRKIRSEVINSKNRAPFFEKLMENSRKSKDSWHTPGHASGYSVKYSIWTRDFYEFFGATSFGPMSPFLCQCWIHCCTRMESSRKPTSWQRGLFHRVTHFFQQMAPAPPTKFCCKPFSNRVMRFFSIATAIKSVHYGTILPEPNRYICRHQ